jgi:hypothetical protein
MIALVRVAEIHEFEFAGGEESNTSFAKWMTR